MVTKKVIEQMLKENTGQHMLDSGGAYGRNWEKNQKRQFSKEPPATIHFSAYRNGDGNLHAEIDYTANLFHWLSGRLEYRADLQKRFDAFARLPENKDDCWLELMTKFPAFLRAMGDEVENDGRSWNSYNGESVLSQVIQGVTFGLDGDEITLLQIHGGCDVRGGYSKPRCFQATEDGLYGEADGFIHCSKCSASWRTDDAYHWYPENSVGGRLEDLPVSERPELGKLGIDKKGNGYCPNCKGKLVV